MLDWQNRNKISPYLLTENLIHVPFSIMCSLSERLTNLPPDPLCAEVEIYKKLSYIFKRSIMFDKN
jgi:hypothetical protein